jgi:hypothetical protein
MRREFRRATAPRFGALAVDDSVDAAGEVVKVANRINILAALQVS